MMFNEQDEQPKMASPEKPVPLPAVCISPRIKQIEMPAKQAEQEKVHFLGDFSFKKPTKLTATMGSSISYKFQKEDAFAEDDEYLMQLASIQDTMRTIREMEGNPEAA